MIAKKYKVITTSENFPYTEMFLFSLDYPYPVTIVIELEDTNEKFYYATCSPFELKGTGVVHHYLATVDEKEMF